MKILIMIVTLSFMFLFLNHPLTFGMIILTQTILISLFTGMLTFNFWFSYILFLIMIGGMLILFIYMTSIASNEKFKFSYMISLMILSFLMIMILYTLFIDYYFYDIYLNIINLINQNKLIYKLPMIKFMNWPNYMIILTVILYLLITLIMVVKITKLQYGPLRQMN